MNKLNKLEEFFYNAKKIFSVHKGLTYFIAYEKHLKRFIGKNPVMIEIGIDQGGSLEMWNNYFDGECTIIGIDINDKSHIQNKFRENGINNIYCLKGDQGNPQFWDSFINEYGDKGIDIILDDGGHTMQQQKLTFSKLIDVISINGLFMCEDLCTSYWPSYGGGVTANWKPFDNYSTQSMMMILKSLIDDINMNAINHKLSNCGPADQKYPYIASIHFYNGICCIEKSPYRENLAVRKD
jgi:hypothetical protein